MIQITKQGVLLDISDAQINSLREQWQKNRAIVLPKLLEPGLLNLVRKAVKRGEFHKIEHAGVKATELSLKRNSTINLLEMLTSDPVFSNVICKITGSQPIGNFHGRVYSISKSEYDTWHQDTGYDYMMTMSINLSPKPYQGGSLQLRDVKTKKVFCDIQNTGPGDALIFDISQTLEHQITPVTGAHPKIAFAGWFCPKPTYQNYMNQIIRKVVKKSRMVITPAVLGTASECLTSQLPNVSETVAFRAVGNKTLLVDLGDDSQCVLNGMGSKIWKSVCKRESPAQTVAALQKDYDLDQETLEAEYRDFLAELKQAGYVT